ncbi:MAG: hypothetical protein WAO98_00015 [Alphaproteobacteria bacterium]
MNAPFLYPDLPNIQKAWTDLTLQTATTLPLDVTAIEAILSGTKDPVPLFDFTADTQARIMDFANENQQYVIESGGFFPYHGPRKTEFEAFCKTISEDFSMAAQALFARLCVAQTTIKAGYFYEPLTDYLHADGQPTDNANVHSPWIIAARVGALPTWVALQKDLAEIDPETIRLAQLNPRDLQNTVKDTQIRHQLIDQQREALAFLRNQRVLKPTQLGRAYLMRNKPTESRDILDGCQHTSSFDDPTRSCFIRCRIKEYRFR